MRLPCAYGGPADLSGERYHSDLIGGKGGTRTLDPGIMSFRHWIKSRALYSGPLRATPRRSAYFEASYRRSENRLALYAAHALGGPAGEQLGSHRRIASIDHDLRTCHEPRFVRGKIDDHARYFDRLAHAPDRGRAKQPINRFLVDDEVPRHFGCHESRMKRVRSNLVYSQFRGNGLGEEADGPF